MTPCQALFHEKIIAYRREFDNEMGCNQEKNDRMHSLLSRRRRRRGGGTEPHSHRITRFQEWSRRMFYSLIRSSTIIICWLPFNKIDDELLPIEIGVVDQWLRLRTSYAGRSTRSGSGQFNIDHQRLHDEQDRLGTGTAAFIGFKCLFERTWRRDWKRIIQSLSAFIPWASSSSSWSVRIENSYRSRWWRFRV